MVNILRRFFYVFTVCLLAFFLFIPPAISDESAEREIPLNPYGIRSTNPFVVDRYPDENGKLIDTVIVPGSPRPPAGFVRMQAANVPEPDMAAGTNTISNVPALTWCFGCSATSAAMMFGHYDNAGYPNMYAGPTNGGVFPMTNQTWGEVEINGEQRALCPLSATRSGLDGRTIRGHVDDYWIAYGNTDPDPFITNSWTEHTPGECTGDYMGTNQSLFDNEDGGTSFTYYLDGSPLYDYTGEPAGRDGCHGLKLFAESRGYAVQSNGNFSQYIYGHEGNTQGFTFADFKAEIDAGRPVLIHVTGHTMLGYGYNDAGSTIYVHDTWDYSDYTMTWGGIYSDDPDMRHYGVTVLRLVAAPASSPALYFPHVATTLPWQTEIALINTSSNQTVTGTLRGFSNEGQLIEEIEDVTLSPHGRRQITVASEFTNHTSIGYIVFDADSAAVQGYTKFYQEGIYRAAIPAVKKEEINTSDIYISHIASNSDWWTGISLVNTTSAAKDLTFTFSDGTTGVGTIYPNEHIAFTIADLFDGQPQPSIESAVISNASGIIGLELFGGKGDDNHLDGLLLTGNTSSTIYYPHVASNTEWWTGIVAYNPSNSPCTITITPYSEGGTPLSTSTRPMAGKEKYVGLVSDLDLPAQTAWFKIGSTRPITGFELFGTKDGNQLAAYAGGGGSGAKEGVFAKIEKNGGWTGIAFVNTEGSAASVTMTAYNNGGIPVATQVLSVPGHAKVVEFAEDIFSRDISGATYIAYSSNRTVVGFQLNNSSDDTLLDGLPALVVASGL